MQKYYEGNLLNNRITIKYGFVTKHWVLVTEGKRMKEFRMQECRNLAVTCRRGVYNFYIKGFFNFTGVLI